MTEQIEQECVKLLFSGKRIDRDTLRILRKFPFNPWWLLFYFVRHLGRRQHESRILHDLNQYLSQVDLIRGKLSYFPLHMRSDVFYLSLMHEWKRLDERLLLALGNTADLKKVYKEILGKHNKVVERRARIAYLRAMVEVCWLTSFLVFKMKQSESLERVISLIRSERYDEGYELANKVHASMKLAYLETTVEKIGYYIVFIVLGIIGAAIGQFGPNTGYWIGALVLSLMFLFLPCRTFMKLYYD